MADKYFVLIPCAGVGERFGGGVPKQYSQILGQSILTHTLQPFIALPEIYQIILVANINDVYIDEYAKLSDKIVIKKVGGSVRAITVLNGLREIKCNNDDWILVHDAVRCCITTALLKKLIDQLRDSPVGGILAVQATDTIKQVSSRVIDKTLPRDQIYLAQTPQMFRCGILKDALMQVDPAAITDDASAVEQLGYPVEIVESNPRNLKITYKEDAYLAEFLLQSLAL